MGAGLDGDGLTMFFLTAERERMILNRRIPLAWHAGRMFFGLGGEEKINHLVGFSSRDSLDDKFMRRRGSFL